VHALLQAGAVADEVQAPAIPLALGAHARVRQPDRRHEVATRQLGQRFQRRCSGVLAYL